MRAQIKSDFEKWLISKLVLEGTKYYLLVGTVKAYFYFEGQMADWSSPAIVNMRVVPFDEERIATGAKLHKGMYRFYIYADSTIIGDTIKDALSAIINEQTITMSGSFHIETEILKTFQRGNKFAQSVKYETIADCKFFHWETV